MTFLDTHIVIWLYKKEERLLSKNVRRALQNGEPVICPIVLLELQYLYENKKIREGADAFLANLHRTIGLQVDRQDWETVMRAALDLSWTRDPFDRIIVAHALSRKAPLLTKDRTILKRYAGAVW